jgi:hypothetical protein
MRARVTAAIVVALGLGLAIEGCRAIEGLNGQYDLVEDCENGVDDDSNDLTDCADPRCGALGYACVAPVPEGWSGPVVLHQGTSTPPPACPDGYPNVVLKGGTGPTAAPVTCGACTCSAPAVDCAATQLKTFNGSSCNGSGSKITTDPGECTSLGGAPGSMEIGDAALTVDACSPAGGLATIPPIQWAGAAVACGPAAVGGGCADGGVCAPRPAAPFGAGACVWRHGDKACPSSYPNKDLIAVVTDDRRCTPCACADPSGAMCSATTVVYSDDQTCLQELDKPSPGVCLKDSAAKAVIVTVSLSGVASCAASGGEPDGSVTVIPTTVCCAK